MFGLHMKGGKEKKDVPTDEINKMMKKGMNDKDIIRHLKAKGYPYNLIEKAMLHAVKRGVDDKHEKKKPQEYDVPEQDFFNDEGTDSSGVEDLFGPPPQHEEPEYAEPAEEEYQQDYQDYQDLPQFSEQSQPVEEIVEGLVEEKWQRFQDEMIRLEDSIERTKADMKNIEERVHAAGKETPSTELDSRLTEFGDRMDDIEARIGGLERAFKQFLPALTRNIESLSGMVAELKKGKYEEKKEVKV